MDPESELRQFVHSYRIPPATWDNRKVYQKLQSTARRRARTYLSAAAVVVAVVAIFASTMWDQRSDIELSVAGRSTTTEADGKDMPDAVTLPARRLASVAWYDAQEPAAEVGYIAVMEDDEALGNLWEAWSIKGSPPVIDEDEAAVAFVVYDGACMHSIDSVALVAGVGDLVWGAEAPSASEGCDDAIAVVAYIVGIDLSHYSDDFVLRVSRPIAGPTIDGVPMPEPDAVSVQIESSR